MIELGVVGLLLAGLIAVPALFAVVPWEITFGVGVGLVGLGMLIGVPAGAMYHLWLWRAVKPAGRAWLLRPTGLHGQLTDGDRPAVMRWFKVGAAGFLLAIVGCAMVAVGALRS